MVSLDIHHTSLRVNGAVREMIKHFSVRAELVEALLSFSTACFTFKLSCFVFRSSLIGNF